MVETMSEENYIELGKNIKAWTKYVPVEDKAQEQIRNISSLPFIHSHVAIMPDVHWGIGATVGSVIPTIGAIIPAAVGVDIGCGMMACKTSLKASDMPENLFELRCSIESLIPHGRTDNGKEGDKGAWVALSTFQLDDFLYNTNLSERLKRISDKHPDLEKSARRAPYHLGTLGTGNHFIEICLDESQNVWIMLHSGSRGIGNKIGSYFIEVAKKDMKKNHPDVKLEDKDLSYLTEGTEFFNDYVEGVLWAQEFAHLNRKKMMESCIQALRYVIKKEFKIQEKAINCHHNYVQKEHHFGEDVWLTRKGAVCASKGVLGIIPGSMGERSFIVRGKGNKNSFESCSHGAGRVMSRTQAKATFTVEDHERDTKGVECRKDEGVVDETPKAYKDIDAVMKSQEDLVEIVHTLKQILCVKG